MGDDICTDLEKLYRSKVKNSLGSGEPNGLYLEIEISVYSPNKETPMSTEVRIRQIICFSFGLSSL